MDNEISKDPMSNPHSKNPSPNQEQDGVETQASHDQSPSDESSKFQGATMGEQKGEGAAETEESLRTDVESLERELEAVRKEADDHKDRLLRAVAEMENIRKRFERERTDLLRFGNEGLIGDILPILDSFDKACAGVGGEAEGASSYREGMLLVRKQLDAVLEKHGLKTVDAAGQAFDPNLHQAIQRVESDAVETDVVKEVYAKGYTLNGRLLRAAMVSVMVPASSKGS